MNSQRSWLVKEMKGHIDRRFDVKLSLANKDENEDMLSKMEMSLTSSHDSELDHQKSIQQNQWIDMTGDPTNIIKVKVLYSNHITNSIIFL